VKYIFDCQKDTRLWTKREENKMGEKGEWNSLILNQDAGIWSKLLGKEK